MVVVGGFRQKALHQPVETGGGGAKGGVEVVGNAVADLGGDYGGEHGAGGAGVSLTAVRAALAPGGRALTIANKDESGKLLMFTLP